MRWRVRPTRCPHSRWLSWLHDLFFALPQNGGMAGPSLATLASGTAVDGPHIRKGSHRGSAEVLRESRSGLGSRSQSCGTQRRAPIPRQRYRVGLLAQPACQLPPGGGPSLPGQLGAVQGDGVAAEWRAWPGISQRWRERFLRSRYSRTGVDGSADTRRGATGSLECAGADWPGPAPWTGRPQLVSGRASRPHGQLRMGGQPLGCTTSTSTSPSIRSPFTSPTLLGRAWGVEPGVDWLPGLRLELRAALRRRVRWGGMQQVQHGAGVFSGPLRCALPSRPRLLRPVLRVLHAAPGSASRAPLPLCHLPGLAPGSTCEPRSASSTTLSPPPLPLRSGEAEAARETLGSERFLVTSTAQPALRTALRVVEVAGALRARPANSPPGTAVAEPVRSLLNLSCCTAMPLRSSRRAARGPL